MKHSSIYIRVPILEHHSFGLFDKLRPDPMVPSQLFLFVRMKRPNGDPYYGYECTTCHFFVGLDWLQREGGEAMLRHDCEFCCNHLTCTDIGSESRGSVWVPSFLRGICIRCRAQAQDTFRFSQDPDEATHIGVRQASSSEVTSGDGIR